MTNDPTNNQISNQINDLPPLREVIRAHKLAADKSFGQHFLLDMTITDRIAQLAGPLNEIHLMEVGPGPGGLTRSLLAQGAQRVSVVEMDPRFVPALTDIKTASTAADKPPRLHIEIANGVKLDPRDLGDVTRIAANLPYNVGTKMLTNWLTAQPLFWDRLVLMFQKEVAMRICARPGESAYGRLAILTASVASSHIAMDVPASCFTPPPKVDSAVVVLEPLPETQRFTDLKTLSRVTAAAFGMRRKMLRRSLKTLAKDAGIDLEAWLNNAGIDPQARPETLEPEAFQTLAATLKTPF